jgi:hypothetical protein
VPDQPCVEQARAIGLGSDSSIVAVQLQCTTVCTADRGDVTVFVRRSDGTVAQSAFGWQEPDAIGPGPQPVPAPIAVPSLGLSAGDVAEDVSPDCIGVPDDVCFARYEEFVEGSIPVGRTLVAITIRCGTRCTPQNGEGESVGTLDDGTTVTAGWSYATVGGD